MRMEAELTSAKESIMREQQEMRQRVSLNVGSCMCSAPYHRYRPKTES